jgi:lipopolysaccharide assembly protein A
MQTMRTIIWSLISAVMAIFAFSNWEPVQVRIWPGQTADTWLSVLIFGSFLVGFLPPFLVYLASKWRSRRTIEQQAQVISDLRTAPIATAVPESATPSPADAPAPDNRPL